MTETCRVHGKVDNHVSAGLKRDGYKQRYVSVEFTKILYLIRKQVISSCDRTSEAPLKLSHEYYNLITYTLHQTDINHLTTTN